MADARINDFPDFSSYGDLAPDDYLLGYLSSVDKTVKVPLSAIIALAADSATSQLSTPAISLSVVADDEIDVSWGSVTSATAYKLYRSETTLFGDADLVYTGSALLFNDTGRTAGTTYYYWLQATGSGFGDSAYSQGSATTTGAGADTTPPVLSSLEVDVNNPNQIILTYNETLQTVGSATTTQWTLTGKTCTFAKIDGTTVTLTFNASFVPGEVPLLSYTGNQVKDVAGNLAPTFTNQAVTNALVANLARLSTPSNFRAFATSTSAVTLMWDNTGNTAHYKLERSTDGSTWTTLSSTISPDPSSFTTYNDTGLSSGTLYWYRLTALGDGVNFSNSIPTTASASTYASSGTLFDTILTFTTATSDNDAGVNGAVSSTNATMQFQFNAIAVRTGLGMRMTIKVSSVTQMVVDFPSDYLGQTFRYVHSDGTQYSNTFLNGDRNF